MQLQSLWATKLTVLDLGNQYEFYIWDQGYESTQKVMTVYAFTAQNREVQGLSDGRFVLQKTDSTVYSASLEKCAADFGFTQESVVYSFRLIQQDWKTGET